MNIVPVGFNTLVHSLIHSLHHDMYSPNSLLSVLLPKSFPILYGGSITITSQLSDGSFFNSNNTSPNTILLIGKDLFFPILGGFLLDGSFFIVITIVYTGRYVGAIFYMPNTILSGVLFVICDEDGML